MFQTLVVPLDISEEYLINLVKPTVESLSISDVKDIHFIHVISDLEYYGGFGFGVSYFPAFKREEYERKALDKLKEFSGGFNLSGKKVLHIILTGNPSAAILDYCKNFNKSLIIMGSRRPNIKTLLLGSTASAVINHASSPVLIMR